MQQPSHGESDGVALARTTRFCKTLAGTGAGLGAMMMFRLFVAVVVALSAAALPIASASAAKHKEARVTPIGSPPEWFRARDYPPAAHQARQSGKVAITLSVDPTGKAIGCEVISSSGFPLLDTGTCEIALRNARFKPARTASGDAIAGSYVIPGVTWTLTDE